MRKKILTIYGVTVGAGLLYYLWGTLTGLFLPCMFYRATGIMCPGCGSSRMFLSMLRFDFVSAFWYNPGLFTAFIYWNIIGLLCFIGKPAFVSKPKFLYISLGISIIFFLFLGFVRNIY